MVLLDTECYHLLFYLVACYGLSVHLTKDKTFVAKKAKTAASPVKPSKGQIQKAKIIDSATKLLARHGLEGTSFQTIADTCGLSQSAVLYHYPSKPDLIEGVMTEILVTNRSYIESALKLEDDGLSRIRKYFRQSLKWKTENRDQAQIVLLLYFYAGFEPRFQRFYSLIIENARTRLSGYLLAAKREKLYSKKINVAEVSQLLHEAVIGGMINNIIESDVKKADQMTYRKWDLLLTSLLGL